MSHSPPFFPSMFTPHAAAPSPDPPRAFASSSSYPYPPMFPARPSRLLWRMSSVEEEIDPGAIPGTSLRIVKYPHPALRAPNAPITSFSPALSQLAKDMLKVMYASRGVGLAAPQVGVNERLMVFNPEGDAKAWVHEVVLANPEIVASGGAADVEEEGCLSFPGMQGDVERAGWVKVAAQRVNGKRFTVKYVGWKARIFQHEYDHLDGVLYIDRLSGEERGRVQPRLDELIAEYDAAVKDEPPAL